MLIYQCKKFAKTELKSCIEEFEEKLNKIYVERKEHDATTRNAMAHQKKVGNLRGPVRVKKDDGDKATDEIDAEGNLLDLQLQLMFRLGVALLALKKRYMSCRGFTSAKLITFHLCLTHYLCKRCHLILHSYHSSKHCYLYQYLS